MRFLLGGIATVAGLVLLFVASFGDPAHLPQQLYATLSAAFEGHPSAGAPEAGKTAQPPTVALATSSPQDAAEQQAVQQQLQQLRAEAEKEAQQPPQAQPAAAPQDHGTAPQPAPSQPPAQPAPSQPPAQQASAQNAAAPTQNAAAPTQPAADASAKLREQREELQHELQQLQAEMAQASQSVAALNNQADSARRAVTALQQQQAAEQAKVAQLKAAQQRAATQAAEAARMAARKARRRAELAQSDSAAVDTVISKLRQQPPAGPAASPDTAPDAASQYNPPSAPPHPDVAYNNAPHVTSVTARARLGMARTALLAGNIEAARQYLEEAQLQLVFRPVTPNTDTPAPGNVATGDVAQALSSLGSGDTNGALQSVDRAIGESEGGDYPSPPPQMYGYGAPYGGNNAPYGGSPAPAYRQ